MQQTALITNAAVTGPGPLAGSTQAIAAAAAADYTLNLDIVNFTGARIRIGIEDSPDGATWCPIAVWIAPGPAESNSRALRSYNVPGLKGYARVNVYEIAGTGASAQITASVSY